MDKSRIVTFANRTSVVAVVLLVYWVFTFICITVFGLRVFRENLTETFYLSVLGILALLAGSLVINVIFNMSRIAESLAAREEPAKKEAPPKRRTYLFYGIVASFPIIFALLFLGDHLTTRARERYLVKSAESMVGRNKSAIATLSAYKFNRAYVNDAAEVLSVMTREEENFPSVSVIHDDKIGKKTVYLRFSSYDGWGNDETDNRSGYIYSCSKEERKYLVSVFKSQSTRHLFSAADGAYELYFPVKTPKGIMVMYISERRRYGKIGS